MAEVTITIKFNGPYKVEAPVGAVRLLDHEGNEVDLRGKTAFSLCRCGASTRKPFCDGTHSQIGFNAAEAAVAQEQGKPVENNPEASSPAKG